MPSYQVRDLMCDFQKVIPGGFSQLTTQARLDLSQAGRARLKWASPDLVKRSQRSRRSLPRHSAIQPSLAMIRRVRLSVATVDHEHFAELALRHFSGERERLQDGELGGPQTHRSQSFS